MEVWLSRICVDRVAKGLRSSVRFQASINSRINRWCLRLVDDVREGLLMKADNELEDGLLDHMGARELPPRGLIRVVLHPTQMRPRWV